MAGLGAGFDWVLDLVAVFVAEVDRFRAAGFSFTNFLAFVAAVETVVVIFFGALDGLAMLLSEVSK